MAVAYTLQPGEARTLQFRSGLRYLVHRPGRRPVYIVFEENQFQNAIEPVGTFATWADAIDAVRARHVPAAAAG